MADHQTVSREPVGGPRVPNIGWGWQLAYGIVMVIGGIAAVLNPFAASFAVTLMASFFFFAIGLMQIFFAVRDIHGTASRVLTGVFGVMLCLFGVTLFLDPLGGAISLTLLIGFFFLTFGGIRLWIAFKMRDRQGWGWLAVAGAMSVVLGLGALVYAAEGDIALLGLFLAAELLLSGIASIAMSLSTRTRT
ncbi:DUF308 domain-containing protein [Fulvimarina sp. MAC3]|uniref:HdeD family acid-resistance protein n=1 Tax=Fulvimarina sp. MAC3 TaxID=3148887 RepID=UPI0031FBC511